MTIIISSTQSDVSTGDGLGSLLREFGGGTGFPDLFNSPTGAKQRGGTSSLDALADAAGGILERLYGANSSIFNKAFVGSGRTVIPGGGSPAGGTVSPLEDASVMQVMNQTPVLSVLVKKRAFASLNHLYDPTLMDPADLWLFRATKRLFARKCSEVAEYERLAKIRRLADTSTSAGLAVGALVSGMAADMSDGLSPLLPGTGSSGPFGGPDSGVGFFTSMRSLERAIKDRQPADTTTWYYDPDVPSDPRFGAGSGVFEITLVASLTTSLSISGDGTCSMTLENPYNILRITDYDIEMAIRDTALSKLVNVLDKAAGLGLANAQRGDAQLAQSRRQRRRSQISFEVSVSGQGATATLDATGMKLTADNLDLVPDPYSLDDNEKSLVKAVLNGLESYSMATRRNLLNGLGLSGSDNAPLKEMMEYSRRMMRKFYSGRLAIQPMDVVHVFMDGGLRRSGEAASTATGTEDVVSAIGQALGLQETWQIDEPLLDAAWRQSGQWLSRDDFAKLYSIAGAAGMHVFAGLVAEASSSYNAEAGRYEMSVSVNSNMEWLRLSRYNAQPSLQQTEGIIYDPLTPFKFQVDSATGLPTGRPSLLDVNAALLKPGSGLFTVNGRHAGQMVTDEKDLQQDILVNGGTLSPIYEMPPGLKYRWKEGIVTTTYNMSTTDPLDPSKVNERQLRRDIGFFAANTAMANMDIANIISTLVTGYPHDQATFIQSALNTGGFSLDTTLNSSKDYFHSLLDVQRSLNAVQGNFVPFKVINADRADLAQAIADQQRLTGTSSTLRQLKNQYAKVSDEIANLDVSFSTMGEQSRALDGKYLRGSQTLKASQNDILAKLKAAENDFNNLVKANPSVWRISGDDIGFSLVDPNSPDEARLFGDRLAFVSQRRREDVIYNRDKNFLIVSEEYDKDFDIQAFALNLRDQSPEMWKNSWESVYELCKKAAETMDLEFFCNANGHLELRPPQYNRTPLTVLNTMLALNRNSGIKIFPEFLTKLVSSRTRGLVQGVLETEYEMMRQAALLGAVDIQSAKEKIFGNALSYSAVELLIEDGEQKASPAKAIAKNQTIPEDEWHRLQAMVSLNSDLPAHNTPIFSAVAQANLVRGEAGTSPVFPSTGSENLYNAMVTELVKLTGNPSRSYPSYDDAVVGARNKNGRSMPASDVSAITDRISEQVSRRSKLLRVLQRALEQYMEVASIDSTGQVNVDLGWANTTTIPSPVLEKMVENDTQSVLGHLSDKRFIIGDDTLLSYRMSEKPPQFTVCSVGGTDALIGQPAGFIAGNIPFYKALGVDFDLWRQYGFRSERNFDRPFLWDAEGQCAPYAKMLLARQYRELVSASAEVVGNEFYQLGDVVYLSDLQLLFYVHAVSHNFTYESGFTTSLTLTYGHPPGEYIPTPLDVIGKSLSNKASLQSTFRVRRGFASDKILATVRFASGTTDLGGLLGGQDGKRNYQVLSGALASIKSAIDPGKPDISPFVSVVAFGGPANESDQKSRVSTVAGWLLRPTAPGDKTDMSLVQVATSGNSELSKLAVPKNMVSQNRIQQLVPDPAQLGKTDLDLLRAGVAAGDQAWTLDDTLDRVVEVRLRQPSFAQGA
jgi:hypothetical protein